MKKSATNVEFEKYLIDMQDGYQYVKQSLFKVNKLIVFCFQTNKLEY